MVQAIEEMDQRDLPQAIRLLGEMNAYVTLVIQLVDNMLVRVKNGEVTTDKGLSFLEMKYNVLLSYLINVSYLILRKCSGERIECDPSIDRLVEIRTVLEKIRPIDHKLKYQIDKLVKTAVTGTNDTTDPSNYKADPDHLMAKIDASDESDNDSDDNDNDNEKKNKIKKTGVYVPPKLAAVHYDGDETTAEKTQKANERARRRAVSGAVLRELKEEYLDTPIEDSQGGEKHMSIGRENQRKIEYEENYMTRLPVTKQEKHRNKKISTMGQLGDEVTSFGGSSSASSKKRKAPKGKGKKSFKKKRHF